MFHQTTFGISHMPILPLHHLPDILSRMFHVSHDFFQNAPDTQSSPPVDHSAPSGTGTNEIIHQMNQSPWSSLLFNCVGCLTDLTNSQILQSLLLGVIIRSLTSLEGTQQREGETLMKPVDDISGSLGFGPSHKLEKRLMPLSQWE